MRATIRVPATSANCGPGFDIFALALGLQNQFTAERVDGPLTLDVGEGAEIDLTDPQRNLYAISYRRACHRLGVDPDGVLLRCIPELPMRRGLGASATAVVAGVLAVSALYAAPWDEQEITGLAAAIEGHADNVAAAVLGGMAIVTPEAPYVRVEVPDELHCALFIPERELATESARRVVPGAFARRDAVFNAARCALLVYAFAQHDWDALGHAMEDRWHQEQRAALYPELPALLEAAREAGALGACLSGSGPTILALTDADPQALAAELAERAAGLGLAGRSVTTRPRNYGARVDLTA